MAIRVLQFSTVIPAGTVEAAPVNIDLDIDNWVVDQIDLEVPSGPSGLMGFYVANNGVAWIPFTPGEYLVWDDVQQSWRFDDQPNASGWSIVGYNVGNYDHTVVSRWHVSQPPVAVAAAPTSTITIVTQPAPALTDAQIAGVE